MTKYGIITLEGGLKSFYQGDHLPEGYQQLSEEDWLAAVEVARQPVPMPLNVLKRQIKMSIDAEAEAERLKYITGGAGQAMTYARKVEQAKAVQSTVDPQPEAYPLLAASIGIDGNDIEAVAATILAMDAQWEQVGAAIERARLAAKRAVSQATNKEEAKAVIAEWPVVD